jgi:signal transduction histidine kinase
MIEVNVIASRATPAVNVDPNQLEMAVLNLAVNARDAMPADGALTTALDRRLVAARGDLALAPGAYVRLSVQDNGEGARAGAGPIEMAWKGKPPGETCHQITKAFFSS